MSQQTRNLLLDFVIEHMRAEGKEEITVATIAAAGAEFGMPDDFFGEYPDEDQREVYAALARVGAGTPAPAATEPDPVIEAEPEPQRPSKSLIEAQNDLGNARAATRKATEDMHRARGELALALTKFKIAYGGAPTPTELTRQFAKSEQEQRRKLASREIEPTRMTRRANTYLDQSLGRGGSASDFVRQNMRTGHRRGAAPSNMFGGYSAAHDQRLKAPRER
jgi:hypothetical protein